MGLNGVMAEPEWIKKRCPFCHEKLGIVAEWKRKRKKVCHCPNCHRKIDERFVVY